MLMEKRTLTVNQDNIASRFFAAAEEYPTNAVVGVVGDKSYLTYAQMAAAVRAYMVRLSGLEKLEVVGLLSENRPEWGIAYMAILASGGVVVPIDPQLKERELRRVFQESRLKKLYISSRYLKLAAIAETSLEWPIQNINLDEPLVASSRPIAAIVKTVGNDPAVMIFTSGTTGHAKRVVLTHGNILSDIDGFTARIPYQSDYRFLSVLPLHHTLEATCGFVGPLLHGCSVHYLRELNSRAILEGISGQKITHFISVPLLYEKMYHSILAGVRKAPLLGRVLFYGMRLTVTSIFRLTGKNAGHILFRSFRRRAGLDSLRLMISGGAPLPVAIARNFSFLGLDFIEGYGMTETSPVLTLNHPERIRFGSVGRALDNAEIKIDSPDNRGVGEILACGPMVMRGYEGNPQETAKVIKDGWLHTGDIGRIDKDGYLHICGRAKNLIVSAAGKNIYPEEIEATLLESPYILETLVYGKKMLNEREEVAALVYPDLAAIAAALGKETASTSEDEMRQFLDQEIKTICARIADYKRIKHLAYRWQEFEKTSTRKIKRHLYT